MSMREIGDAEWIGTTARDLIARRNFVGRVLAVVTGAIYVVASAEGAKQSPGSNWGIAASQKTLRAMTNGEVLWLAQNHLPLHPRAIRGNFDFDALNTGMTFESDGECLRFGQGNHVGSPLRFADACAWQPRMIDPGCVAPREIVLARARELTDRIGLERPVRSLRDLVGLGQGLTPSGDDFVGGLLFAQWHLRKAYPDTITWDQRAVDELIDYARARTNVISHAILRDHATGQSVEPMHNLILALLRGESLDQISTPISNLLAIGNTSGREMLAGLTRGVMTIDAD